MKYLLLLLLASPVFASNQMQTIGTIQDKYYLDNGIKIVVDCSKEYIECRNIEEPETMERHIYIPPYMPIHEPKVHLLEYDGCNTTTCDESGRYCVSTLLACNQPIVKDIGVVTCKGTRDTCTVMQLPRPRLVPIN